jgi:hypothetical protein
MQWTRQASIVLAAVLATAVLAPSPSRAIEYPWCAVLGGSSDSPRNCGFVSFEQCLGYVHGLGGFCERNSFYTGPDKQPTRKPRKRIRH